VQLFSAVASVEHAGVCAYASNYPPVGEYVDAQTIKFTGTPMFKIVLEPVPCKMSAVYNLAVSATAFCTDSAGVRFALSGTDRGVSYQLFRNNSAGDGAVLAGTGSAATFSGVFGEGAYTAQSIADGVQCPAVVMAGTHNITVNPLPTITYLSGSTEQLLYASGTLTPIRYTTSGATTATITGTLPANLSGNWFNGTLTLSGAVPSVSGSQTFSYTVGARNQSTGCESASRLTGAIRLLASLPAYSTNVTAAAGKSWSDALTVVPTGCTQTDNTALDYAYTERSGIYYYSYLCIVKYVAPFCASPWYPPTSDITGITSSDIKTVIGKAGRYSPAYSDTGNYYLWLLSPDPAKPVALDDGSWGPYSTSHAPTVRMAFRCVK
jgi:hypothetical protein